MQVTYAICHMMGMSSACSNPILYGCLNENFWKEFKDILCIERYCESVSDNKGDNNKSLQKKFSQKSLMKGKRDHLTVGTDYQPCNTVSTDMTVLTKC